MRYIAFIILVVTLFGCVKDDFCIEPNAVFMTIDFKTYDSTSLVDTPLINASVYDANNTSYKFADNVTSLSTVNVALDRNMLQQTLVVKETTVEDTIKITYTKEDVFISNGCGYQTYFELQSIAHTTHSMDTVNIIVRQVDNTVQNPHLEVIYN